MQNILSKIKTHSTIAIGDKVIFNEIKQEIINTKLQYLFIEKVLEDKDSFNLKVEDVKTMQSFISLKRERSYILIDKSIRNTQIQNSLLKLLEEGNENVQVIIISKIINYFLPTVISRVQILNESDFSVENKNLKAKNIFSECKKKLIISKDFAGLEKLIKLEDLNNRGLLSEKQLSEYLGLI
jgi:DNA polymerase III delta prime subunit